MSLNFNKWIWEAQPKWARVVQIAVMCPVIATVAYILIFDRDDTRGLMLYCVILMIPVGVMQAYFFVRASVRGGYVE